MYGPEFGRIGLWIGKNPKNPHFFGLDFGFEIELPGLLDCQHWIGSEKPIHKSSKCVS